MLRACCTGLSPKANSTGEEDVAGDIVILPGEGAQLAIFSAIYDLTRKG
jgi:hypothetical protein